MKIKCTSNPFRQRKKLLKFIMRTFIFLLCSTAFGFTSSEIFSQNTKIHIDKDQMASIDEVFDLLRDQTDYTFIYEENLFKDVPKIQLKKGTILANKLLEICFSGKDFKLDLKEDKIIIIATEPSNTVLQTFTVSGTVMDPDGQPLPGANIVEKGTTNGVTADFDGNFSIDVVDENAVLLVSYIGFASKEVLLNGQNIIQVSLQESAAGLDEVVVIGYGSVKKKDLTGSVSSIKSDNIEKINTPTLNDALQGLAAGVQVSSQTGRPGEAANIFIRGGSSISADNAPLYVIDGFPQLGGDNLDLNPQDIESVEILKDASAGSIYGARASNGVILITTKSGKKGDLKINYSGKTTFSNIIRKLETLDIVEYATVQEGTIDPEDSIFDDFRNPQAYADSTSVNWQDEVYRTALMQKHDLQIVGGGEQTNFFSSLGYLSQEGIAIGSEYSRLNVRVKIDTKLNDKLTAGTNLSYSYDDRDGPYVASNGGVSLFALTASPHLRGDATDNLADYVDPIFGGGQETTNPIKWLTESLSVRNNLNLRSQNYIEYTPTEPLTLRVNGAMSYLSSKNKSFVPPDVGIGNLYNGTASISHYQQISWLVETTANYKKTFGKHKVDALAGFSAQSTIDEDERIQARDFPIDNLGFNNIGLATQFLTPSSGKAKQTLASVFGRLNYSFDDKYILTGSLRYDGSSNFGITNKWGLFPSGAFAWKASEEQFVKDLKVFSNLKLRASYGVTGNNSIGNYRSLLRYQSSNITINSQNALGLIPGSMANQDLKWEENEQIDFGIDMGFFNNRFNLTADYYKKKSNDLLLNAPVPFYSGFTTFTNNIGDIEASGYEFDIKGVISKGNLNWSSSFNLSFPSTKVNRLSDSDYFLLGSFGRKSNVFIVQEGEALGAMYGYVFDGVNQNQEDLDLPQFGSNNVLGGPRYKDISGPDDVPDGEITSADRTVIGNGLPDWFGGFNNQFQYKNFDLSVLFTFRYGNEVMNINKDQSWRPGRLRGGLNQILNAWTPDNPTNENFAWGTSGVEFDNASSWMVEDGSFLRLQNITLGYTLPSDLMNRIGMQNCRLFISGDRLLTWAKYTGYDPEVSDSRSMVTPGVDNANYPLQKLFTLGINISF